MKIRIINKKTLLKIVLLFAFTIVVTKTLESFAMQNYYKTDFATGLVTASTLNVRCGTRD